ncbi:hypothetical protein [Sphingomonas molluscorum]|uniref:hypothetical protein n=1 Tax=Sphingomonas molluscorum TaxID=418184 RepID=UPI0031E364AC
MKIIAPLLATVLLCGAPAHAQRGPTPRGPMQMDVAGVRLGMSLPQAQAAATAASYACRPYGKELTFDEQVDKEAKRRAGQSDPFRQGTGTMQLECKGPDGEDLRIDFAQMHTGPVVDEYRLQIPGARIDLPAVRRQLAAKYGRPTVGNDTLGSWCGAGYRCGEGVVFSEGPIVVINAMTSVDIMATRGKRARTADEAAVAAAADAAAPKKTRAAF